MATVSKWTPFGVALTLTANVTGVTRTSATSYQVNIEVYWKAYYSGAQTNYGMTASSGGKSVNLNTFGTKASKGEGEIKNATYSISGNGAATKTITVTFKNYNSDYDKSATKTINLSVSVPAWTSYKVTYNANGGTGAPSTQTKWKDQDLPLSSDKPTRTGYTFKGWATSSTATTASYQPGATYKTNAALNLHAVWEAITYTITYNANDGTGSKFTEKKTHDKSYTISSNKFTRTNYTFKGWATSSGATTATYQAGSSYTANDTLNLYAVWELDYVKPRITGLTAKRGTYSSSTFTANEHGTYIQFTCAYSCDRDITGITVKVVKDSDNSTAHSESLTVSSPTTHSSTLTKTITSKTFGTENTYELQVTVTDKNGSSTATYTITGSAFTIDLKSGGKGIAFGKPAEVDNLCDIGFKTRLSGGLLYPILEPCDLDTLLTPNTYAGRNTSSYTYTCSSSSFPITSGTFMLEVFGAGPSTQVYQRLTLCDKTNPAVYERWYYSGVWSEWTGGWVTLQPSQYFDLYNTSDNSVIRCRKDGRVVEVRGVVTPKARISGGDDQWGICTLPAAYRPKTSVYTICQGSGACVWMLQVSSSGSVIFARYRNPNGNTISGGTYEHADPGAWLPFHATFLV